VWDVTEMTIQDILDRYASSSTNGDAVAAVLSTICATSAELANTISRGSQRNDLPVPGGDGSGDVQHAFDLYSHELFVDALSIPEVRSVLSEEALEVIDKDPDGVVAVAIDPIDGSSNLDSNGLVGSIFSLLPVPSEESPFLASGDHQLAAGLVVFGPATTLALTTGAGTDLFVHDLERGTFVRTHEKVVVPMTSSTFYINASNRRFWERPTRQYIDDLVAGSSGSRHRDFNMRWMGAVMAEAFSIMLHGGIYLYPGDARKDYRDGRLRLIYEANPLAMLIEQAGGQATNGETRIMDLVPASLHQRTPLIFGSAEEVARYGAYARNEPNSGERSPLFSARGIFRD
jgi:fructose-1,6-bisphosphatase I